ncbi:MAG: DUF5615 family PIN-like protein [Actinomycetota bacterium]|nr:DUF5615 family PIN-like protein [Actinomycetota bacterium]
MAEALGAISIDATTVAATGLAGACDPEVFGAAVAGADVVLTENVGDYARTAAEHRTAGGHHPGVLVVLSDRFFRRPAGIQPLVAAIQALGGEDIQDRVVHLERVNDA